MALRSFASLLAALAVVAPLDARAVVHAGGPAATSAVAGELLVRIDDERAAGALHRTVGARRLRRIGPLGLDRIQLPAGMTVEAALARYRRSGAVRFAEPNRIVRKAVAPPDDPRWADQWALPALSILTAWDVAPVEPVTVAIVDTGIRLDHEDLAANLWTHPGEIAGNGIDDDGDAIVDDVHGASFDGATTSGDPNDDDVADSHGTHVAGIVGAVANNRAGIAGVAGLAGTVRLMAVKVLHGSAGEGTEADVVEGITWAVDHGARVINCSMEVVGEPSSQVLAAALEYADANGALVVSAAGNYGEQLRDAAATPPSGYIVSPASIRTPNNVAVAALDAAGAPAWYTDFGATVADLAAPGGGASALAPADDILSTVHRCTCGDSNYDGVCTSGAGCSAVAENGYGYLAGTSMAAPHVSGIAALVWSTSPSLSHRQVRARLLNGTVPDAGLAGVTIAGGRAEAAFAVEAPAELPSVFKVTPYVASGGGQVTITGANFGAAPGTVTLGGAPLVVVPSWSDWEITATLPANAVSGPVQVNGEGSTFHLQVGDLPPTVTLYAVPARGVPPFEAELRATATDPAGSIVRWEWDFGEGELREYAGITDAVRVSYSQIGGYRVRVRVTDDGGQTAQATALVTATPQPAQGCSTTGGNALALFPTLPALGVAVGRRRRTRRT